MVDINKQNIAKKTGDTIERAGEKISDAGAEKVGSKVYNAGDKIEHSADKQPSRKSSKY